MAEGVEVGTAYVSINPSASGFASALSKDVSGAATSAAGTIEGTIGGSFKKLAGIASAAFAGKEIFGFLEGAVDQARESNKIAAQTEAVIKSTGGAAHVTAAQFSDLANSIAAKTGIDDEQIQSAENLLATFTNIRNEVGKNNDIFSQATKIAVDMGAALGGDASSNAIQLGKALNDPVKGITALTRVGVTFSAQQKDQITTMVKAGDTMGAQKIILAELNKEFGGSAEAQGTATDKLKVIWGNFQENLGNELIPIIDKVATILADNLPSAMDLTGRAFQRVRTILAPIASVVQKIFSAFSDLFAGDIGINARIESFADKLDTLLGGTGQFNAIFEQLGQVILEVSGFIGDHLQAVLIGLGVALVALTSPITAVVGGLIYAYTQSQTFRDVVAAVADFLGTKVVPAVSSVIQFIIDTFAGLVTWTKQHWAEIQEAITHVINVLTAIWNEWGDDLMHIVQTAWGFVQSTIGNVIKLIEGIIEVFLAVINGDWGKAWDGIKDVVHAVFNEIGAVISGAIGIIKGLLGGIASTVLDVAGRMWNPILDFLKGILRGLIEAWNKLDLKVPKVHIPGTDIDFGGFDLIPDFPVPNFGGGGIVPGVIGAPTLAVVHGGEVVLPSANGTPADGFGTPIFGGDLVLQGATMTPADITTELAWYAKTSGR